jgi:hypothetical protein
LWDCDVNGLKTCNDNQSQAAPGGDRTPRGLVAISDRVRSSAGAQGACAAAARG